MKPTIITGLPSGTKEAGQRVDFKPEKFALSIITKGYRLWWSRAGLCPCVNVTETEQPDPTCTLCDGQGMFHFLPEIGLDSHATDIHGNPIEINERGDAVMIQAIMRSITNDPQIFERFGDWLFGVTRFTTQPENKLGYRDRLELVDSTMVWSQIVLADGTSTIPLTRGRSAYGLRYRPVDVVMLRTLTTVYRLDVDYRLDDGEIKWIITPPAKDARLTIHYRMHPVYQVLDHVNAFRDSLVKQKSQATTVAGQFKRLPIQAMGKLEFLLKE